MVKVAMSGAKRDRVLHRTLNARQFALKLIANVTYGYTAAGLKHPPPSLHVHTHPTHLIISFTLYVPHMMIFVMLLLCNSNDCGAV